MPAVTLKRDLGFAGLRLAASVGGGMTMRAATGRPITYAASPQHRREVTGKPTTLVLKRADTYRLSEAAEGSIFVTRKNR